MKDSARHADAVWLNGRVLTMDAARPWASAFAIGGGRLLAVGDDADVAALAGPGTRRENLAGRFVMPGLIDTHMHGLMGALRDTVEVYVGLGAGLPSLLEAVTARAKKLPPGQWIVGGPWHMRHLEETGRSPREMLDEAAPAHPVYLRDVTYHTAWVNSKALEACGIDARTPDPENGRLGRLPDGAPNGLLYETAQRLVQHAVQPTPVQMGRAVQHMRSYLHSLGITGFKEAMATEPTLTAYREADQAGALGLHLAAHLVRRPLIEGENVPIETLERWREQYRSTHLHPDFIKLFLDGVAPTGTASFFEPYLPACGGRIASSHDPDALLLVAPATLCEELIEFDRRGFTVKMHAVGDRAARAGLDAIAAARRANGPSGLRHEIGHCAFVHADDHRRFADLDAVAEMSPRLWFPNPVTAGQIAVLGPARTNRCHQIRSLLEAGAELTYGSDWPAAAADANPWIGLAGMLTRRNPFGLFEGTVGAPEAIPLERALPLMTTNAARAMRLGHLTGSLEAGKSADFIVLERPLDARDAPGIAGTRVEQTVFEGEIVFGR